MMNAEVSPCPFCSENHGAGVCLYEELRDALNGLSPSEQEDRALRDIAREHRELVAPLSTLFRALRRR